MARDFDADTEQYLGRTSAVVSAYPFTLSCRVNLDTVTVVQTLMGLGSTGGTFVELGFRSDGELWALVGSCAQAAVASGVSTGQWFQATAVFSSNTSRAVYSGTTKGTNTTNCAMPSVNRTSIGGLLRSSASQFTDGRIAEAGIWNVALTDAEVASLVAGNSPQLVRPASLVDYWPLWGRHSPEIDLVGRNELTLTAGPVFAAHPRVIYPSRKRIFLPLGGALTVSPDPVLLRITAPSPTVKLTQKPSPAVIEIAVPAPSVRLTQKPAAVALELTPTAPATLVTTKPAAIGLRITCPQPIVRITQRPSPAVAEIAVPSPATKFVNKPSPIPLRITVPAATPKKTVAGSVAQLVVTCPTPTTRLTQRPAPVALELASPAITTKLRHHATPAAIEITAPAASTHSGFVVQPAPVGLQITCPTPATKLTNRPAPAVVRLAVPAASTRLVTSAPVVQIALACAQPASRMTQRPVPALLRLSPAEAAARLAYRADAVLLRITLPKVVQPGERSLGPWRTVELQSRQAGARSLSSHQAGPEDLATKQAGARSLSSHQAGPEDLASKQAGARDTNSYP